MMQIVIFLGKNYAESGIFEAGNLISCRVLFLPQIPIFAHAE